MKVSELSFYLWLSICIVSVLPQISDGRQEKHNNVNTRNNIVENVFSSKSDINLSTTHGRKKRQAALTPHGLKMFHGEVSRSSLLYSSSSKDHKRSPEENSNMNNKINAGMRKKRAAEKIKDGKLAKKSKYQSKNNKSLHIRKPNELKPKAPKIRERTFKSSINNSRKPSRKASYQKPKKPSRYWKDKRSVKRRKSSEVIQKLFKFTISQKTKLLKQLITKAKALGNSIKKRRDRIKKRVNFKGNFFKAVASFFIVIFDKRVHSDIKAMWNSGMELRKLKRRIDQCTWDLNKLKKQSIKWKVRRFIKNTKLIKRLRNLKCKTLIKNTIPIERFFRLYNKIRTSKEILSIPKDIREALLKRLDGGNQFSRYQKDQRFDKIIKTVKNFISRNKNETTKMFLYLKEVTKQPLPNIEKKIKNKTRRDPALSP